METQKTCAICNTSLPGVKKSTLDHIVPVARGGSNDLDNLRLVHDKCNNLKDKRDYLKLFIPPNEAKKRFKYKGEVLDMINNELKRQGKKQVMLRF